MVTAVGGEEWLSEEKKFVTEVAQSSHTAYAIQSGRCEKQIQKIDLPGNLSDNKKVNTSRESSKFEFAPIS